MTRYDRAAEVGAVDDGRSVFAAALPDGPILVLSADAARVWRDAPGTITTESDPVVTDIVAALADAGLLTLEED